MLRGRPRLTGALVGLSVMTLCLSYLFNSELGGRMELWAYDLRVRYCNNVPPASAIVHVDIDDASLMRVGRWPWHRDQLAEVVRAIADLGAANIMIDLLLSEPEPAYLDDPRFGKFAVAGEDVEVVGELSDANRVFPDEELAGVFRSAGNVILATQFDIGEPDPVAVRLRDLLAANKDLTFGEATEQLAAFGAPVRRREIERELLRLRVRQRLLADFSLNEQQLADELGETPVAISEVVAGQKRIAAQRLVAGLFAGGAAPSRQSVLEAILGNRKEVFNADYEDVLAAYFTQLGLAAIRRSSFPAPQSIERLARPTRSATPPEHLLADSATSLAAVNPYPDADSAVRRVPLLVRYDRRVVPHMGLAAAARILKLDLARMELAGPHRLAIPARPGGQGRVLPLDEHGNFIINWTRTAADWRSGADFPHIPAAKLYALVDVARQMRQNRIAINYKLADVVGATKGQITVSGGSGGGDGRAIAADSTYRRKVNELLRLQRRLRRARLSGGALPLQLAELESKRAALQDDIQREERQAAAAVEATCQQIDQVPPEELASDPAAMQEAARFRRAREILTKEIPLLEAANQKHEKTYAALKAELTPALKGKQVFLGFAATAQGDIVPTPIDPITNGVMCHAQVLNSILQNRFIAPADRRVEVVVCLVLVAAVSLVTAMQSPRVALLVTLGLMLGGALLNAYVVFMRLGVWFSVAAPLVTMFIAWAFVTLFRQLTAERDKRLFAKQLSQYTSPIIASRIAENPEAVAAFKIVQTRDMSFFFSDLAGFTTLSEQENPEVVQHVLNTYLERMSQVIWSRHGLINKFMGDGIMAFFNPSVDPLPAHARVACETSLAVLEELERLKADTAGDPAAHIFSKLSMRIGLATGLCKNGDLGSELKADYTAIGDVVNLAARLEPANKVFGTQIMVSGALRDAVQDAYEFRYLAELQVKGKAATVPVYEIVCRRGDLTDEQRRYIERFEAGVELYKAQKWNDCIVHFTRLLARRFDDLGASRYIDACQEFKRFPPEEGWTGALELKEK
jgi:adenylate cyclase